jgi:hypothetical protein
MAVSTGFGSAKPNCGDSDPRKIVAPLAFLVAYQWSYPLAAVRC